MQTKKRENQKICPSCGFDQNRASATECEICQTPLIQKEYKDIPLYLPEASSLKLILENKTQECLNFVRQIPKNPKFQFSINKKELKKPINIIGIAIIGMGLAFWSSSKGETIVEKQQKEESIAPEAPKGVFNYGGAAIFAPIVSSGFNNAVQEKYPGFELRYAKPLDGDFSSLKGIEMLLDGELSFAFNSRSLTDQEYSQAILRQFNLKQVPIAIDGVVLFGNSNLKLDGLNRDQVTQIFNGEINNWNQIDNSVGDMPIIPVVVQNESFQSLGIKSVDTPTTEYLSNYTQALRKIIETPGAISFASASLVQNQQLIKIFALADGSSSNYVKPWVNGQLNLEDFKNTTYPLTRRIFLNYRQDNSFDAKAGKAYSDFLISKEGQEILQEAGFVPIY